MGDADDEAEEPFLGSRCLVCGGLGGGADKHRAPTMGARKEALECRIESDKTLFANCCCSRILCMILFGTNDAKKIMGSEAMAFLHTFDDEMMRHKSYDVRLLYEMLTQQNSKI